MLNSLTGKITSKKPGSLFLATGGVEWEILMPDASIEALPEVGAEARVYVYLHHREDQMKLYGFAAASERRLFLELLKVDGIGPRQALRILSSTPPDMFLPILDAGDVEALSRTPGIGKKTAQKIVLTLRGKLRLEDQGASSPSEELIAALVEMGFDRKPAAEAVDAALKELAEGKGIGAGGEEEIMRRAIVRLSAGARG